MIESPPWYANARDWDEYGDLLRSHHLCSRSCCWWPRSLWAVAEPLGIVRFTRWLKAII